MTEERPVLVLLADFRPEICKDARHWFARHGLDWRDFVRNGIMSDRLRATGDQISAIERLEARARKRIAQNGQ